MTAGYTVPYETLVRLGRGDAAAGRRMVRAMVDLELEHQPIVGPTPRPLNVRAAVEADEDGIMALIRMDIRENAEHIAPVDEERALAFVRQATQKGEATIGVIDDPADGIVGMIALQPYVWWWSSIWHIQEMFNYLHSKHRSAQNARALVYFSRWFVDEMSARLGYQVYLLSGVTATRDTARKVAVYRRLSNFVGIFCCYPEPAR